VHVTSGVELLLSVKIIVPCKREGVEPPKTPLPLYLLSTFLSSLYDTRCVNYPSALQAVVLGPHKIAPYSPEAGRQLASGNSFSKEATSGASLKIKAMAGSAVVEDGFARGCIESRSRT